MVIDDAAVRVPAGLGAVVFCLCTCCFLRGLCAVSAADRCSAGDSCWPRAAEAGGIGRRCREPGCEPRRCFRELSALGWVPADYASAAKGLGERRMAELLCGG